MKSLPKKNLNDLTTPLLSPITPNILNKKSTTEMPIEDSPTAKQSREIILQTKLIVVELLQVLFFLNLLFIFSL